MEIEEKMGRKKWVFLKQKYNTKKLTIRKLRIKMINKKSKGKNWIEKWWVNKENNTEIKGKHGLLILINKNKTLKKLTMRKIKGKT